MKKIFTIFILFFLITGQLLAVPAKRTPIVFTQPDGKSLTILQQGDERIHWRETLDGYTLLHNSDGYLTFAFLDDGGNLQASDIIATDIAQRDFATLLFLNSIEKKLWFSDAQKQLMLQVWQIEDKVAAMHNAQGDRAVIGQYKTLCAFVQFPEKAFIKTMDQFEGLMNQIGYTGNGTGSVRDFYKEASYDLFDLIITKCGIYTAPNSEAYYAGNDGTQRCDQLARWLAEQVAAEPDINFADYDSNGDNRVDGFHFIFAGFGQEWTSNAGHIWSHKWQFTPPVFQNGKYINVYSCSPELHGWSGTQISDIGVICHEMTHAFGASDYYDTNYGQGGQYVGTGNWDLMADGCNNGNGNRPAHPNMYEKVLFGWVVPVLLSSPTMVTDMPNSTDNPVAYRINTGNGNEHYLLENIQKTGFNTSVPGSGLLIYHAHSSVGTYGINDTHPQRMYPVCASSSVAIPVAGSSNYGSINSGGCTFPGTSNKTMFTSTSTPSMFYWTNTPVDKPLTNISHNTSNKTVSFQFMDGFTPPEYTLTLSANPTGGGTVSGGGTFPENSSVTAIANANSGFSFINWTKNGVSISTNTNYTFTLTENTTLVANFKSNNANLLSLTVSTGELTPEFSPNTTNYTVNVDFEDETISITGVAEDAQATVTGNVTNSPLTVGDNSFTLTVTAEDNTTKSYEVTVVRAVNVIENYQSHTLKIYPNPAHSEVTIESENMINEIVIFDSFGRKLQEIKNISEKYYQLDIRNYINNIYYLQVDGVTVKIVVSD
jgi:M6 family metalloprotease-like protein